MKKILFAAMLVLGTLRGASGTDGRPAGPDAPVGIGVAYPEEGGNMPAVKSTFILGVATPTGGALTINGAPVQQHSNGAFLTVLPVESGTFTFHLEYRLGTSSAAYDRHVTIAKSLVPLQTDKVEIEKDFMLPDGDVELQAGDFLYTQVKGTPGVKAEVKVEGGEGWLPMLESPLSAGLYQAALPIGPDFRAAKSSVKFKLSKGFWKIAKAEASGSVTAPAPLRVVESSTDTVYVRSGPERGYMLFPSKGTRFVTDGRLGSQVRLRMSADESGWGNAGSLRVLPEGTLPPEAVLSNIKTAYVGPRETWVRMDVTELVPAEVIEDGDWVHVRLHHAVSHCNWIVYDSTDTYIKEVRWRQENARTVRVSVRLDPKRTLWGWRLVNEPGQLSLVLRQPPAVDLYSEDLPFKGLNIVLDPGHSPGKPEGAVGPTGTRESEMNMAIALELRTLLELEGASVTLTREGWAEKGLPDRPRLAWEKRADLFISIHNNALPDGANPFSPPRGFMVFYYHPHSMALARSLHRAYQKQSPLPDEGLRYGNLLVARESGMPAVLTESDYMMFPDRELRLKTPEYQKKLAKIHRDGIFDFLKAFSKTPAPSKVEHGPEKKSP